MRSSWILGVEMLGALFWAADLSIAQVDTTNLSAEVRFSSEFENSIFSISMSRDASRILLTTFKIEPENVYADGGSSYAMHVIDLSSSPSPQLRSGFPGRRIPHSTLTDDGRWIAFGLSDETYHWWPFVESGGRHWADRKSLLWLAPGSSSDRVIFIEKRETESSVSYRLVEHGPEGPREGLPLGEPPRVVGFDKERRLAALNYGNGVAEVRELPSYELLHKCITSERFGRNACLESCAQFSDSGKHVALAGRRGFVIWNIEENIVQSKLLEPSIEVAVCCFASMGTQLLVAQRKYAEKPSRAMPITSLVVYDILHADAVPLGALDLPFVALTMSHDGSKICFSGGASNRTCTFADLHFGSTRSK